MADRGGGRPLSTAKTARLLMIDDSEVNRIVSKFKSKFSDLVSTEILSGQGLVGRGSPEED